MRTVGVFLVVVATLAAQISPAAAAREREPFLVAVEDSLSLATANYQGDRPTWANLYAEPEIRIYDDPAPFFPSDDTGSPSDDTDTDSAVDLDGF
jgi:hypothetical protein